jgi:hypothetical protein
MHPKKRLCIISYIKMFQRRPGLRAAVWTMVPWPWRNLGPMQKATGKKLGLVAPIMRGNKTKGILATTVSCQKKIRSWLVRKKDVEESLPSGALAVVLVAPIELIYYGTLIEFAQRQAFRGC